MRLCCRWLLAAALAAAAAPAGAQEKRKGVYQAQRAGWMLGMYVGEGPGQPYPFVTQLDPNGDAQKKGVRVGDELLKLDGFESTPLPALFDRANRLRPGKQVELWVRRGSQTLRMNIIVPRVPSGEPDERATARKKDGEGVEDGDKKKKKKKRSPIVIKPIPADP